MVVLNKPWWRLLVATSLALLAFCLSCVGAAETSAKPGRSLQQFGGSVFGGVNFGSSLSSFNPFEILPSSLSVPSGLNPTPTQSDPTSFISNTFGTLFSGFDDGISNQVTSITANSSARIKASEEEPPLSDINPPANETESGVPQDVAGISSVLMMVTNPTVSDAAAHANENLGDDFTSTVAAHPTATNAFGNFGLESVFKIFGFGK